MDTEDVLCEVQAMSKETVEYNQLLNLLLRRVQHMFPVLLSI